MSSPSDAEADLYTLWSNLADEELSASLVHKLLAPVEDDIWVCAACVDRTVDDVEVERALLDLGIGRTDKAMARARATTNCPVPEDGDGEEVEDGGRYSVPKEQTSYRQTLTAYFNANMVDAQLCQIRAVLLDRMDRLRTYTELQEKMVAKDEDGVSEPELEEGWEDDPWAETGGEIRAGDKSSSRPPLAPPLPLSVFLTSELSLMCRALASQMQFEALRVLTHRHRPNVFPHRFEILSQIPIFADPSDFYDILPGFDTQTGAECSPQWESRRGLEDWSETEDVKTAIARAQYPICALLEGQINSAGCPSRSVTRSAEEIQTWYKERAELIVSSTGMVDLALGLVQHGVSQGVPGLEELGEDLTLVSRLIYDAPGASERDETVTMSEWTSMHPHGVMCRYLAHSTPDTIVLDIRRLIMPYLFILESRCERAGKPDPSLVQRLFYDYILGVKLNLVVPIFEASKPTMVASQRLVSDDEDLARLALACLYGSSSLDEWISMSRVFECLPAWNFEPDEDEEDEINTTVASLAAFLTPSTARPHCSPSDLLVFFRPLPAKSLTRALDILDVHLESGELLARWGVPVRLRWFLQSSHDEAQQRNWATKMARQLDPPVGDLDSEDVWLSLLEDMLKMSRPGESYTSSAFGALSGDDIRQIFFRGLLSTGKFNVAKQLIRPRHGSRLLENDVIEKLCLECSREFYDNANSGNYNFGDMKLAYDCLSVPPLSPTIQREREFIEATSRICSFNVVSRSGVAILPIEIRLTGDKLSLISRVMSSNESAYQHTEVILELVRKLGFRDDILAEVKTLAMVADAALQAEDFSRAFEVSERMVNAVLKLRQTSPFGLDDPQVHDAVEVCWVACFQLGRQPEAEDVEKKMALLGRALELCPPDKIADILLSWRKLEAEDIERRKERNANRRPNNDNATNKGARARGRISLTSKLQSLHMPSPSLPSAPDAAALASHAFSRVAASFPFTIHGRPSEEYRSRSREGSERRAGSPDVQAQARQALQRGIGWLIGADEGEL